MNLKFITMKKIIICIGFLAAQILFSQEKKSVEDFKNLLIEKQVQFSEKLSIQDIIQLEWRERKSLYNSKIQTFIGYENGEFKAVVSVLDNVVFGSIWYNGEEIKIKSHNDILSFNKKHTTQEHHQCFTEHKEEIPQKQSKYSRTVAVNPSIKNTNVFRIYRLAVAIDYSIFSTDFQSNDTEVSTFLANLEAFLNEIYERDLGVRFEIINNDKLIKKTSNTAFFNNKSQSTIVSESTSKINFEVGDSNYDVGIMLTKSTGSGGLAFVNGVYEKRKKAMATASSNNMKIIAHEIGHLFGGIHTFSNERRKIGDNTEQTEKSFGYSVMSYGRDPLPRDFFSLSSIERIREKLVMTPYYDTPNRDFFIGTYKSTKSTDNIPYGIVLNNNSPIIDKTKIKAEYIIPHNTFFQFYIPASDVDSGNTLQYMVQQRDVRMYSETTHPESITKYATYKAVDTNLVKFQNEYNGVGALLQDSSIENITGDFTFWIGVRDKANGQHTPYYDLAETKVMVKTGTPFVFTNSFFQSYKGNDKITLKWNVDNSIFPQDSKVRILLSDDFGKTFKHILVHQTENDGTEEITLPNIEIGNENVGNLTPAAGIIKVEVIDGLAYALSAFRPSIGGFTLKKINAPSKKNYIGKIGINTEKPNASLEIGRVTLSQQPQGVSIPQIGNSVKSKMNAYVLEEGLMIYNTDKKCIEFWNGQQWTCLNGSQADSLASSEAVADSPNLHRIGINTNEPKASLDIRSGKSSDVEGLIIPQISTNERNNFILDESQEGVMLYNTDKKCIEYWNGTQWICANQ